MVELRLYCKWCAAIGVDWRWRADAVVAIGGAAAGPDLKWGLTSIARVIRMTSIERPVTTQQRWRPASLVSRAEADIQTDDGEVELELTLGFEPVSSIHKMGPAKRSEIYGLSGDMCKMEMGLDYPA
ncbi:hypothetical protein HHK36_030029 [Tetracentron sinense]|uniref:Uncharacterized protein n=1 Tax=Tetracentron sinense TaxID=13715 RepID=A0A834YEI2_TETSI|nr:hypothetical protein HHK36_030029 [Tetracentron sinense]